MEPLIKPESVRGICGSTGLEGQGGLDLMGEQVLINGGEEPMSCGVSAGLTLRSGEGPADSIEYLTWSSGLTTGSSRGYGEMCCRGGSIWHANESRRGLL
jgi:hypothetical protein